MELEKSIFETQNPKLLSRIASILLEKNFTTTNPYKNYDSNYEILTDVLKFFSQVATDIDLEFFCKLINLNQDKIVKQDGRIKFTKDTELEIPQSKLFTIHYSTSGFAAVTETYKTTWSSYDELWAKSSILTAFHEGNFDWWEGENVSTNNSDYEIDRFLIDDVEPFENDNISESTLNKLDKKTLLMLKEVIEKRLRVL